MAEREITVCTLAEIADPGAKEFEYDTGDGREYGFVVCRDGQVTAFVNSCPHTGASLNWGPDRFLTKAGDMIMCGVHGAIFRPHDGHCTQGPCEGQALTALPCRVTDGEVRVTVEG
ncbi:Rieske (2Fe-2S) protein [Natronospira bacteriovora]|uniref:Rieske 2Fe-2S domain-containing protein n=1 Tax=Natronospira bacteriovora TaxID=3069753 RepID=A0ABU0W799_9GAMM|nr:Rieske 2Fe-2S domain-containing protein [Natronospira sp. AB-CW4]MDQ2069907.1 Rieske 2Fe-2S domain-containing protein [Natronospira sp. AB-CW4]